VPDGIAALHPGTNHSAGYEKLRVSGSVKSSPHGWGGVTTPNLSLALWPVFTD
jgi:hypothetical protein